jgi:hypothetical protein
MAALMQAACREVTGGGGGWGKPSPAGPGPKNPGACADAGRSAMNTQKMTMQIAAIKITLP